MKIIILVMLLLLNSQISISQESTNATTHVFKLGFKGKVKKVEQECFVAIYKNGQIVPKQRHDNHFNNYIYEFDSGGNLIEVKSIKNRKREIYGYNEEGKINERTVYSGQGKLQGKWSFTSDSYGSQIVKTEYGNEQKFSIDFQISYLSNFNESKSWIEREMVLSNEIQVINCDKYDIKGNCVEGYGYDLPTYFPGKFTRIYDDNGNLEATNFFKSNGETYSSRTCKYDAFNHKIEETKDEDKLVWTYDEKGRNIECKKLKINKLIISYIAKYDGLGNIVREEKQEHNYTSGGELAVKILMPSLFVLDAFSKTSTRENDYDENGNMIKRIEFENGKPTFITLRKFDYYD